MDKAEREKLREHANRFSVGRERDFTCFTAPEVIALLDHIEALEGQIEMAYLEGYQCGWNESNEGYKPVAGEAWNKSKAKENNQ